jgi:hypothetical protein
MAHKHYAIQPVAEIANNPEQGTDRSGIQPVVHYDILELEIEFIGEYLRGRDRSIRRTRQDQVELHIALRQSLAYLRGIAFAARIQWPVFVGQLRVIPTRLGVTDEK